MLGFGAVSEFPISAFPDFRIQFRFYRRRFNHLNEPVFWYVW